MCPTNSKPVALSTVLNYRSIFFQSSIPHTILILLSPYSPYLYSKTGIVVVSKPISFFFLLFITYKYGHIKFGKKHEEPEYSGITYFSMLFAAGVAVGIFYYGVSEPLWHQSSHWYANGGYRSQDEIDQFAMNQTIYHWGLHACT